MKKSLGIVLMLLPALLGAQSFDAVVDFGLELSSFGNSDAGRKAIEDGRIAILEGLLGDTVLEERNGDLVTRVTLIGGSWIGTEEVRSYSCFIEFSGDQWLEIFPVVKPRDPGPDYIPAGSRLLVAVRPTGIDEATGTVIAAAVDFRVLK